MKYSIFAAILISLVACKSGDEKAADKTDAETASANLMIVNKKDSLVRLQPLVWRLDSLAGEQGISPSSFPAYDSLRKEAVRLENDINHLERDIEFSKALNK